MIRQRWASTGLCSAISRDESQPRTLPFPHICDPSHQAIYQADNNNKCSSQRPSTTARPRRRGTRLSAIPGTSTISLSFSFYNPPWVVLVSEVGQQPPPQQQPHVSPNSGAVADGLRRRCELFCPTCTLPPCLLDRLSGPRFWVCFARPAFCPFGLPLSLRRPLRDLSGGRGCGPLLRPGLALNPSGPVRAGFGLVWLVGWLVGALCPDWAEA